MNSQKPQPNSSASPPAALPPSTTAATATATATRRSKTTVPITALDGIVNVNALFTLAVFIGLNFTNPVTVGAGNRLSCNASVGTVRQVIVYEVISFSFFLFSSLIAQSLKLAINLASAAAASDPHTAKVDAFCMKYGLLLSAVGSVLGCVFLMLSMVGFIQVKLGVLGCGGKPVYAAVGLVALGGSSILVYIFTAVYVFCFM